MKDIKISARVKRYLIFSGLGLVVLVLFLWVMNHYILDRPSFCTSCHLIQSAYDSWVKSKHKPEYTKNSCNACHVQPGLLGSVKASVYGVENTYIFFFGVDEDDIKASKPVYCSQKGCHPQMEKSMVGKRVRVNHSMHLEMGYSCVICHDRIAHGEYAMVKNLSMMTDFCFNCHNDEVAPRKDCRVCHVYQDQMLKGQNSVPELANIELPAITSPHYQDEEPCQACHLSFIEPAEKSCVNCHEPKITQEYQQVKTALSQNITIMKNQIDEINSLLAQINSPGSPTWTQIQSLFQTAQNNYSFLLNDNSQGAHNQKLAETMIKKLNNDLQKIRYLLYSYKKS